MSAIDITICIPTIPSRELILNRLLAVIEPQLAPNIEVLVAGGVGQLGEKLNKCFNAAQGTYVVNVDDDDLLVEDYVESVAEHLKSGVDYIGYYIKWMEDGILQKSIPFRGDGDSTWQTYDNRGVSPKCLVKKEIAIRHIFGDQYNSDFFWCQAVQADVKSHAFVSKDLYIYDHWNEFMVTAGAYGGSEDQRSKELEKPQRIVEKFNINKTKFSWI